jgi:hypothetical protein
MINVTLTFHTRLVFAMQLKQQSTLDSVEFFIMLGMLQDKLPHIMHLIMDCNVYNFLVIHSFFN